MKQILKPLLFFVILCTACINEDRYSNQDECNSIVLNPVSESFVKAQSANNQQQKTTKGTPTYSVAEMTNMSVFSYYTQNNAWNSVSSTATPNRMNNLLWTQANGSWHTGAAVNWDATNGATDNYSFFSYAPMANATNGITVTNTTGTPTIQYTVPTTVANQPDITVATAIDMHPDNGRVNLVHKHALTAIAIKIFGQGETVSNIRLKNISTQGTLSLDNSSGIIWSNLNAASSNTTEYNFGLTSASPIASTSTPTNIVANNGYLMMIPQDLTEDAMLIVNIGGNDLAFGLYNQDIKKWEAGTIVTYTFNTFTKTTTVNYTTDELSNCYIINPSSTDNLIIRIPVRKAASSPASNGITNWKVGVTSQSSKYLFNNTLGIRFTGKGSYDNGLSSSGYGSENSYFELFVPRCLVGRGRFTVSLGEDNTTAPSITYINYNSKYNGEPYSWNWTFWVTDYNPYGTRTPIEYNSNGTVWAWSVPGGKLFNINGMVVMDRYLFAGYEGANGAVFQYGRKDPFTRLGNTQYNNVGDYINEAGSVYQKSIEESITSHNVYVQTTYAMSQTGSLSWESQGYSEIMDCNLWNYANNSNKKTLYDPSPIGFRVAPSSLFVNINKYSKQKVPNLSANRYSPTANNTNALILHTMGAKGYGGTLRQSGYYSTINIWSDSGFLYRENLDGTTQAFPPTTESMYLCPILCVVAP